VDNSDDSYGEGKSLIFWSAVAIMVGFLIAIFGAILRGYRENSYDNALHAHIPPGIVIIIGMVVAIFGVFGIVLALMRRS